MDTHKYLWPDAFDMALEPFTLASLGVFIGLCAGALGACISAACKATSHSRCSRISLCCGAAECMRTPMTAEELEIEMKNEPKEEQT